MATEIQTRRSDRAGGFFLYAGRIGSGRATRSPAGHGSGYDSRTFAKASAIARYPFALA
jgi:hypothetical protein